MAPRVVVAVVVAGLDSTKGEGRGCGGGQSGGSVGDVGVKWMD